MKPMTRLYKGRKWYQRVVGQPVHFTYLDISRHKAKDLLNAWDELREGMEDDEFEEILLDMDVHFDGEVISLKYEQEMGPQTVRLKLMVSSVVFHRRRG